MPHKCVLQKVSAELYSCVMAVQRGKVFAGLRETPHKCVLKKVSAELYSCVTAVQSGKAFAGLRGKRRTSAF
jgi:hypothetical protein